MTQKNISPTASEMGKKGGAALFKKVGKKGMRKLGLRSAELRKIKKITK
jgi:hypothetical protein